MDAYILKNALLINEGKRYRSDIYIDKGRIERIDPSISVAKKVYEIDAEKYYTLPGAIDDQVHFREPGLTHKATIESESKAAMLGGVTTFMEMPNTNPPALTIDLLEDKYKIAAKSAHANFSFFMGTSNDNIEEIKKLNPQTNCGVKIFMGSSTGNMLVDDESALEQVFRHSPTLIATHCEVEHIIRENKERYKNETNPKFHPIIRSREACIESSKQAISLAEKNNARLHILHISTAEEVDLFRNDIPLKEKKITAEACVHHLWFSDEDYNQYGNQIVCNPAIKTANDRAKIWEGLLSNKIDVIATDHAPHTWEEKSLPYPSCPSGVPLVQHSVLMILEKTLEGVLSIEKLVEKMSHAVADCFQIKDRGYLREGYFADIILVNPQQGYTVTKENIAYKCGWSPLEGFRFGHSIDYTFISGMLAQQGGKVILPPSGQRISFDR